MLIYIKKLFAKKLNLEAPQYTIWEEFSSATINLNDTFHPAADGEDIDGFNLYYIFPVYKNYGRDALLAYTALKRGYDPLKRFITPNFLKAKEEITKLLPKIDFEDDHIDYAP